MPITNESHLLVAERKALRYVYFNKQPVTLTMLLEEHWPLGPHLWRRMTSDGWATMNTSGELTLTKKGEIVLSSQMRIG